MLLTLTCPYRLTTLGQFYEHNRELWQTVPKTYENSSFIKEPKSLKKQYLSHFLKEVQILGHTVAIFASKFQS